MQQGSVGYVKTKKHEINKKIELKSGKKLGPIQIAYETYGKLNKEKTNAIYVCHALSGGAHAAGINKKTKREGWWNKMIGPGKAIDTEKYYVISSNVLGSCKGTTGPSSTNPATGEPYGTDFPLIKIDDMVKVQKKLIKQKFGIEKLLAVIGGSMGGMQALKWAKKYPNHIQHCIPIATTARSSPQQIAFNEVGRRAILSDPNWNNGQYYNKKAPRNGLALARMIGHITYLSDESMREKFGRNLQNKQKPSFDLETDFEVESYLNYKGKSFVKNFDPNTYLYLTKAIDYFDLTNGGQTELQEAFNHIKDVNFLVIAVSSDWLYPPYQSKEIVRALEANDIEVKYSEIRSSYGHDAFLLEKGQMKHLINSYLSEIKVSDISENNIPLIKKDSSIKEASEKIIKSGQTHLPVVSQNKKIKGIITAWDISKAVAQQHKDLEEIMTKEVITATEDESITSVTKKLEKNNISALPVVNQQKEVIGIITSDIITQLIGKEKPSTEQR
ncbi:homoserine O-acetyltransferase [archaeon SCG-AAA382B04]|nr:homoserine O-acetyltransferase [archaeon SCG-AAA382B04]